MSHRLYFLGREQLTQNRPSAHGQLARYSMDSGLIEWAPSRVEWKTAYEVDFTVLPTNATALPAHDATVAIDDRNWRFETGGSATEARVVNGTGLVLAHSGTSNLSGATRSGFGFSIPLTSSFASEGLVPNGQFTDARDVAWTSSNQVTIEIEWAWSGSSAPSNSRLYFGVEKYLARAANTNLQAMLVASSVGANVVNWYAMSGANSGGTLAHALTDSGTEDSEHRISRVNVRGLHDVRLYSDVAYGSFSDEDPNANLRGIVSWVPAAFSAPAAPVRPTVNKWDHLGVTIYCASNGQAATFTAHVKRLRVRYK